MRVSSSSSGSSNSSASGILDGDRRRAQQRLQPLAQAGAGIDEQTAGPDHDVLRWEPDVDEQLHPPGMARADLAHGGERRAGLAVGDHANAEGVGLADERRRAPGLAEHALEQAHLLGEDAPALVAVVDAPADPERVPRSELLGGGLAWLRERRD